MHRHPFGTALVLVSCSICRRLHEAPLSDTPNPVCPSCAVEFVRTAPQRPQPLSLR